MLFALFLKLTGNTFNKQTMSNFVTPPIENTFRTTLTQKLAADATALVLYCAAVPSGTIPNGQKVRITINARKGFTYQEDVMVTSIDTVNKTMTIASSSDRGLARYNGDSGGRKEHGVLSEVIISDPFGLWLEVQTAINSKVDRTGDTMTGALGFSGTNHAGIRPLTLTSTQRDALGFSGTETAVIKNSTSGEYEVHVGGGVWAALSAGSTQPFATQSVAGRTELPTQTEMDNGTLTGATGAALSATPDVIQSTIQKGGQSYVALGGAANTYTGTMAPAIAAYTTGMRIYAKVNVANTGASTLNLNNLGAKSIKKTVTSDLQAGDLPANAIVELVYDGTNLQLVSRPVDANMLVTVFARENIVAGALVAEISDTVLPLGDTGSPIGDGSSTSKRATRFRVHSSMTLTGVTMLLYKQNAPSDALQVRIMTDAAGVPSGTTITNGLSNTISNASIQATTGSPDPYKQHTFTFNTPPTLNADTYYWLVIERTGANDGANYFVSKYSSIGAFADFRGAYYNSGTPVWNLDSGAGLYFNLSTSVGSRSGWNANSEISALANVKGFAVSAINAGNNGLVQAEGVIHGLSGLTAGSKYYVGTSGNLSAAGTPGSYGGQLGVAIDANNFLIKKRKIKNVNISWAAGNGFYTKIVEIGFIPTRITVKSLMQGGGNTNVPFGNSYSSGVGYEGNITWHGLAFFNGNGQITSAAEINQPFNANQGASGGHSGTILNVHDTSLVIQNNVTGGSYGIWNVLECEE